MAGISEAKRAANRENARKSTGPKTDDGKERSRANAYKHGMAGGGIVMAEDLRREAEGRVAEWTEAIRPRSGPEAWLVERAAVDATRVDAAVRCGRARLAARLREDAASTPAGGSAERHVDDFGEKLLEGKSDGPWLLSQLRSTVAGCDWLIGRWEDLDRRRQKHGRWGWREFMTLERLIGQAYYQDLTSREYAALTADFLLCQDDGWKADPERARRFDACGWTLTDLLPPGDRPDSPGSKERANARLTAFVAEQIAELREEGDRVSGLAAIDASESADLLLVDLSPEGILLHRYEAELHRRVHQSLRQLDRLVQSRPAGCDAPASPRNEATGAAIHDRAEVLTDPPAPAGPPAPISRNEPTAPPKSDRSKKLGHPAPLAVKPVRSSTDPESRNAARPVSIHQPIPSPTG